MVTEEAAGSRPTSVAGVSTRRREKGAALRIQDTPRGVCVYVHGCGT